MALERYWKAIPPVAFTAPGTALGRVTVSSTKGFKVKMVVIVEDPFQPRLKLEVKRVSSSTVMELGPTNQPIGTRTDLSAYGTGGPSIVYSFEQDKATPTPKEIDLATYAQEPTVARRVVLVDRWGDKIDSVLDPNGILRLAVDTELNVESLNVDIIHPDSVKIDNVLITDTVTEFFVTLPLKVGQFNVKMRDGAGPFRLAFTPGGTATNYVKVNRGANYGSPMVDKDPITLYFKGEGLGTIEVTTWYKL